MKAHRQEVVPANSPITPVRSGLLQRKCACGNHMIGGGKCSECSKKKRFGLQTKLKVNEPEDLYEQEADRIADQVMATPAHQAISDAPPRIQCLAGPSGEQMDVAPHSVDQALASPGRPLEPALRQDMERRFDHDFSQVRVHTGAAAEQSAWEVNANACTVGHDIVFGAGQFTPGTQQGRRLLAHELTHVVQQGSVANAVQRSLKFEIQTVNYVWAVKKSGAPDPRLLPRKYAPTTVGYEEGSGEERGDRPAYLAVGKKGGPARKKGDVIFVEAEEPLVTEEAKSGIDAAKPAQIIREYKFKTMVKIKDIIGKTVAPGQLELVSEKDNAKDDKMKGKFNPNTFEFKYINTDGTPLEVHLDEGRKFKKGHVKVMKVGRGKSAIDKTKAAQYIEAWKVTEDPAGDVDFLGKRARVERLGVRDNAKDKKMKGLFNPNTWEKRYFLATDFIGKVLKPLDVHMDKDGRLRKGAVKFMVKEKLAEAEEQTAIEVQSEHEGFLEFETPKWFRDRFELEERINEAVDITKAINGKPEIKDKAILDAMTKKVGESEERKKSLFGKTRGRVVEWPAAYSTAHLKKLHADKRGLMVEIVRKDWLARIQASETIALSEYGSLLREHEWEPVKDIVIPHVDKVFTTAFSAARLKDSTLNESLFTNLKGFLQLIVTYIVRAQAWDMSGKPAKFTFQLMARTNFGSMHKVLLSVDEKAMFKTIVGDPKKSSDYPILIGLKAPIDALRTKLDAERVKDGKKPLGPLKELTKHSPVFSSKVGTDTRREFVSPTIYDWLVGITKGKDLLSGHGISAAMGARSVETKPGHKDFRRARFEIRGTVSHGGNDKPASKWVSFAKEIFDSAMKRAIDTPDDPRTPKVDESSKTGLKK